MSQQTTTDFKEKIIEMYEQVAIQAISPNEARKRFNSAVSELVRECLPETYSRDKQYTVGFEDACEQLRERFRAKGIEI